ncbi:hydratase [Streptomyces bottropensis ATCC 25435]|uniref:Hydratase n=1 Tax=Streptomyces bottropensis ATCC 25435 TaxID=1054862 RepID=M3F5V5_9ACTN|nr:hydratase [Streptomyces bottropensis ATCC 25435]
MDEEVLAGPAKELADAARARVPVRLLSERFPGMTVQDAYRLQRINAEARVAAGARTAGHKIDLTSVAMQEQMGMDEPGSGVIVPSMVAPGGCLVRAGFMNPRIETEIAFRLGRDLPEPRTWAPSVRPWWRCSSRSRSSTPSSRAGTSRSSTASLTTPPAPASSPAQPSRSTRPGI